LVWRIRSPPAFPPVHAISRSEPTVKARSPPNTRRYSKCPHHENFLLFKCASHASGSLLTTRVRPTMKAFNTKCGILLEGISTKECDEILNALPSSNVLSVRRLPFAMPSMDKVPNLWRFASMHHGRNGIRLWTKS